MTTRCRACLSRPREPGSTFRLASPIPGELPPTQKTKICRTGDKCLRVLGKFASLDLEIHMCRGQLDFAQMLRQSSLAPRPQTRASVTPPTHKNKHLASGLRSRYRACDKDFTAREVLARMFPVAQRVPASTRLRCNAEFDQRTTEMQCRGACKHPAQMQCRAAYRDACKHPMPSLSKRTKCMDNLSWYVRVRSLTKA